MKRMTTDDPKGNVENLLNFFFVKDMETWVRGGGPSPEYPDVRLADYIRDIVKKHNLSIELPDSSQELNDELFELLFDGTDTIEGIVATLNAAAWAFSLIRGKLHAYEDTGLTPDEVDQIRRAAQYMMFPTVADFVRYSVQNFEELEKYRKAEKSGLLITLPCKVGDKIRDELADYIFTVEKIETCHVRDGDHLIFRCGNAGTTDYMAFYDFEIGDRVTILTHDETEEASENDDGLAD